jgi:hypothetical protein
MRSRSAARLSLALTLALTAGGARISRITVPEEPPPAVRIDGGRVVVSVAGVELRFELLDAAARAAFLEKLGAWDGRDLFEPGARAQVEGGVHPIDVKQFVVFRLDLVNGSGEEVNLHPASVRCVANETPHFAMEYTAYYSHFVSHRRMSDAAFERLKKGFLMEPATIAPGKRANGLLVFRDVAGVFKRFHIEVTSLLVGAESKSAIVPFDVVREKVKQGKRPQAAPGAGT